MDIISREKFKQLWHKHFDHYFIVSKEPKIEQTCSPRLADFLIDVANGVSTECLAEKYKPFAHHVKSLEETGCFCIDSISPSRY